MMEDGVIINREVTPSSRILRGRGNAALLAFLWVAFIFNGSGAEVVSLSWETRHACAPVPLAGGGDSLLPAFRAALASLPEAAVIQFALSQPALLGLSAPQSASLSPHIEDRYRRLSESPAYAKATSQLAYSFSDRKPTHGSANLHVPENARPSSRVILFLHGYGGSLLWYQHWLSEVFPESIILCPAYGVNPANISAEYVLEAIAAAEKHLGFSLRKPSLVGLSAGGAGACRAYAANPERFAQLVCMGSLPPDAVLRAFPKNGSVCFIAGGAEPFVGSGQLHRAFRMSRSVCLDTTVQIIPKADHFFLLTQPGPTRDALANIIKQ